MLLSSQLASKADTIVSMVSEPGPPLRMPPESRREQLLQISAEHIGQHGVGFSLDEIARAAGVSPPLMRHYFRNRDGLLIALFAMLLDQLLEIWTTSAPHDFDQRFSSYLEWISLHPWAHKIWMSARAEMSALHLLVLDARAQLILAAGHRRQHDPEQQFRSMAWVAIVEASVQDWLTQGSVDRESLLRELGDVADRLEVRDREL